MTKKIKARTKKMYAIETYFEIKAFTKQDAWLKATEKLKGDEFEIQVTEKVEEQSN